MRTVLRKAGEALLSLFYPPHCLLCGSDTTARIHLCTKCTHEVRPIQEPFCRMCSQPFEGEITGEFSCSNCAERKFHFDCAISPYRARGPVREFIHRFKYEGQFFLRHQLAEWTAHGLQDYRILAQDFDALVPVPLHPTRRREREFNQAEEIARLVARQAGRPMWDALQRTRYTTTQTRFDRQERMENLRDAFRVRKREAVHNRHIILVDDVFTTGSTVEECARVLRAAGAASVRALTVARG